MTEGEKLAINPNISFRWERDTVLLSTLVPLNRTAGEILQLLKEHGLSREEILTHFINKYPDVKREIITTDINNILNQLIKHKVIGQKADFDANFEDAILGLVSNSANILKKIYNNTLSAPVRVSCKITSECNAKCLHCYASEIEPGSELSFEEWSNFFQRLASLHVFSVTFTGGDPLCRRDVLKLVNDCREKNLRVTIVTNGLALSRSLASDLKDAGVGAIFQSLDGANPRTHDEFRRVKRSFNKVLDNIKILQDLGIRTAILTTVNRNNIDEIEELIDLVYSTGVKIHSLMRYIDAARGLQNNYLMPTAEDYYKILPILYRKSLELKDYSLLFPDIPAFYYQKILGLAAYNEIKSKGLIGQCSAGITTIAISATGGIKVCDVGTEKYLGNIREHDLQDVWLESPILKAIRELNKDSEEPCSRCNDLKNICWSGCRGLDYQLSESEIIPFKSDRVCEECFRVKALAVNE